MRFIAIVLTAVVLGLPATAQEFIGEVGACMMEDASGAPLNAGTCKRLPAACTSTQCQVGFEWTADQYITVITLPFADAPVGEGTGMNGQEAYAPAALRDGDPRDCIWNAVSGATFCWLPGVEAMTVAASGLAAWDMLLEEAQILQAAGGDDDLLAGLQGKYVPEGLNWSCGEVGRDGGALAIIGNVFHGLETQCVLSNGQRVGAHGAALFEASCTGEGDTWQDEYLLRRDDWGTLAWIRSDAVGTLQACN